MAQWSHWSKILWFISCQFLNQSSVLVPRNDGPQLLVPYSWTHFIHFCNKWLAQFCLLPTHDFGVHESLHFFMFLSHLCQIGSIFLLIALFKKLYEPLRNLGFTPLVKSHTHNLTDRSTIYLGLSKDSNRAIYLRLLKSYWSSEEDLQAHSLSHQRGFIFFYLRPPS